MKFISVLEFAKLHNISERTARNYCAQGKIEGAFLTGKTWNIPAETELPERKKHTRQNPLLKILREQKAMQLHGGIYHRIQIDLTYNSNHIEGSRLTHDQTRFIFETHTLGATNENIRIDDIIETTNHFRCIDYLLDTTDMPLSESLIKELHSILKTGTSDSLKEWFRVGEYKLLPNEVGGVDTCPPERVRTEMRSLLQTYNHKKRHTLEDIVAFHYHFEHIHPFQDGNGRVGRLIMFRECLIHRIVPFIITDELKHFYYRGLTQFPSIPEYLLDTCRSAQDDFEAILSYFRIKKYD